MYAVIRYFNYRKEVSFTILKTFYSLKKADNYALQRAESEFGSEKVVQGVAERRVYIDEIFDGYTKGDGYDQYVYSVIKCPEPDDEDDTDSLESKSGKESESVFSYF